MTRDQAVIAAREIDAKYLEPVCERVKRDEGGLHLYHLRWMVAEMASGMSEGKTMRWLGYIQGVLVGVYHVPLEDMKQLSKRASEP